MKRTINFDPQLFNNLFFKLRDSREKIVINKGWFATGKTFALIDNEIVKSFEGNYDILILKRNVAYLKDVVVNLFKKRLKELGVEGHFSHSIIDNRFTNLLTGSEIVIGSFDKDLPVLFKEVRVSVDDAHALDASDLENLYRWSRTKNVTQYIFNINPYECAVKEKFINATLENVFVIDSEIDDNRFLDPSFREILEKTNYSDPKLYKAIKEGAWLCEQ